MHRTAPDASARLMSAIPLIWRDSYSWAEAISLLRNNRVGAPLCGNLFFTTDEQQLACAAPKLKPRGAEQTKS